MKKKKIQWVKVAVFGISVILGLCIGFGLSYMMDTEKISLLTTVLLLVWLYVSILLHVVVHEAGHLVFGLLTGYGFSSFRVGPFMLLQENGKLCWKRHHIPGTAGQCLMTPPELIDGKMPYVLYNLGGCIANLVFSALCMVLWALLPGESAYFAFLTAVVGLVLALSNGIPLRMGGIDNDGQNALSLGKSPQALWAFWAQMKVVEQTARGVRLKDMPETWFQMPEDSALGNAMVCTTAVFSCSRLLDQTRLEEAEKQMAALLSKDTGMVGLHRNMLVNERIFCLLIAGRTEEAAALNTDEQQKFAKSMAGNISVLRTQYAYALLAERDPRKAETILVQFEKRAKTHPYACEVESERELLILTKNKAEISS